MAELSAIDASSDLATQRRFCLALLGFVVVACWIVPAAINPLWLDETGTYWIAKDGIREVFERSYYWSNFSPYYVVAWAAVRIGGANELLIRLPSLICMAVASYFVYRIGARLADEEAGLLAAVVFSTIPDIAFAAADARPYAFSLMVLTGYVLALLQWLKTGALMNAIMVPVLAALTMYAHVSMAPGLVAPAAYALWQTRRRVALAGIFVVSAALTIPLVIQLRAYLAMDTVHTFAERPSLPDLWNTLAPGQLFTTFWVGLILAYVAEPFAGARWKPARSTLILLAVWMLLGPLLVFTLGRLNVVQLYVPRYLMYIAPAGALLFGSAIRVLHPVRARRTVLAVMVAISSVGFVGSSKFHHGEDWPSAVAALREQHGISETPVVIPSCFVEAQSPKHLADPRLREVLFAPELVYPPAGRVIHIPFALNEAYMQHVAETELAGKDRFFTLSCGWPESIVWLWRWSRDRGYRDGVVKVFGGLQLRELRR